MKLAIVVGHNMARQGAVRQDTGESEFVWNSRPARRIERLADDHMGGVEALVAMGLVQAVNEE